MPPLVVAVEGLQPDAAYVRLILTDVDGNPLMAGWHSVQRLAS
jgi:hypothetical protein